MDDTDREPTEQDIAIAQIVLRPGWRIVQPGRSQGYHVLDQHGKVQAVGSTRYTAAWRCLCLEAEGR